MTLCNSCKNIPFETLFFRGNLSQYGLANKPFNLGTILSIIQTSDSCEFCALVTAAVKRSSEQVLERENSRHHTPLSMLPTQVDGKDIYCSLSPEAFCRLWKPIEKPASIQDWDTPVALPRREQKPTSGASHLDFWICRLDLQLRPNPWIGTAERYEIKLQPLWHDESGTTTTKGTGRLCSEIVDIERLRFWLSECESEHGDACSAPNWLGPKQQLPTLRVIDVESRKVVEAPLNCRYLALSYVWGQSKQEVEERKQARLTSSNARALGSTNGLDALHIPRTIADTMSLIHLLGERFLWVDALCIMQDDKDELMKQTSRMDSIYSGALLTIIAGAGKDAEAGLPGLVAGGRPSIQRLARVSDKLSVVQAASKVIPGQLYSSTWNTRGWTFQERLLSRRVLIFTEQMVYWNCETSIWDEETILEPRDPQMWLLPSMFGCHDEWQDDVVKFSRLSLNIYVTQYNLRSFTFPDDVLPAFLGILNRIRFHTEEDFHWGLPCAWFGQALAWSFGAKRRNLLCPIIPELGIHRQVPYPSWSWLSWDGFIGMNSFRLDLLNISLEEAMDSELEFYMLMSDGTTRSIQKAEATSRALAYDIYPPSKSNDVSMTLTQGWKSKAAVQGRIISTSEGLHYVDEAGEDERPDIRVKDHRVWTDTNDDLVSDTGRLVFWTSHARLETRRSQQRNSYVVRIGVEDVAIRSHSELFTKQWSRPHEQHSQVFQSGMGISQPVPDEDPEPINDAESAPGLTPTSNISHSPEPRESQPSTPAADAPLECPAVAKLLDFIVISRYHAVYLERGEENVPCLNLLVVQWSASEPGVASRIALVQIAEEAWIRASREWKLVVLE